jgi:hypothetical protein
VLFPKGARFAWASGRGNLYSHAIGICLYLIFSAAEVFIRASIVIRGDLYLLSIYKTNLRRAKCGETHFGPLLHLLVHIGTNLHISAHFGTFLF